MKSITAQEELDLFLNVNAEKERVEFILADAEMQVAQLRILDDIVVDHGGLDVPMPQELLGGPDVGVRLLDVRRTAVAEAMALDMLG